MERTLAVLLCLQSSLLVTAFQCSDKVIISAVKEYNVENTHKHWFDCIQVNTVDSELPSEPDSFLVKFQIGETKCRKEHSNIRTCPVKYGLNAVMGECSALVSSVINEEILYVSCNLNHGRTGGAMQSGRTKRDVQMQGNNKLKRRPGMFSLTSRTSSQHLTKSPPVLPVLDSASGRTKRDVQMQGNNKLKRRPGMFSLTSRTSSQHLTKSPPVLPVLDSASGRTKRDVQMQGNNKLKRRPGMFSLASRTSSQHLTKSPPVLPVLDSASKKVKRDTPSKRTKKKTQKTRIGSQTTLALLH